MKAWLLVGLMVMLLHVGATLCEDSLPPQLCDSLPRAFYSTFSEVIRPLHSSPHAPPHISSDGIIYVDFASRWSRVVLTSTAKQHSVNLTVWIDYNEGTQYDNIRSVGVCSRKPHPYEMGSNSLPSSAVFITSDDIEQLEVYKVEATSGGAEGTGELALKRGTCLPAWGKLSYPSQDGDYEVQLEFSNAQEGVPGNIMEMPITCKEDIIANLYIPQEIRETAHLRDYFPHSLWGF